MDFQVIGVVGGGQPDQGIFDVASGAATTILKGQLVAINNGYAAVVADSGCASADFYGWAAADSSDTVAAAGTVPVIYSTAGLILRGAPTTAGNLAVAILFDRVTIDVSGTTQTVDENDAGSGVLTIVDYNSTNSTIDVVLTATL